MKHKKKQNVGILFELLTKQVVQGTLSNDKQASQNASKLINKYFSHNTPLYEELSLFNTLLYNQTDSHRVADRLLTATMGYAKQLDEEQLSVSKRALSEEISSLFNKDTFYKTKLSNYKVYASIQQLLNNARQIKSFSNVTQKIILEETILDHLINNTEHKRISLYKKTYERLPIDNLTNQIIQSNFNKKYDEEFNGSQKTLLKTLILNDQKQYGVLVDQEVKNISNVIAEALGTSIDPVLKIRLEDVQEHLKNENFSTLSEANLLTLLTYTDLAHDLKEEVNENASQV